MRQALDLAAQAACRGEVPVGALVVREGRLIGSGVNGLERFQDPTAHAEIQAIRQAAVSLGSRRLLDTALYVTLEPCAMCAGAAVLARIPRLVFGAFDPTAGACGSLWNLAQDPRLNHRCRLEGGVLGAESAAMLKKFFTELRSKEQ